MRKLRTIGAALLVFCLCACIHSDFAQKNLKTFHEFTLANGIRVVVKISTQSRIQAIVCVLKGGKALVSPEKAGLDTIVLQLMAMESKNYPDVKRRALLKKTSATIKASDGLDLSMFSLKTIDTYFDETFDLYADLFMNPTFPQEFFDEVSTNLKNNYRSSLTDGYARVSLAVNRDFFSGHPYSSYLFTPETIDRITRDDVRQFYQENFGAERMTLFAVGNFDLAALHARLEATFGTIKQGTPAAVQVPAFTLVENAPLILDPHNALKEGVSYVRANFQVVPIDHEDYWALLLATEIVSDILNDLVRTKNSMVYSIWTLLYGKKSNYGNISAYRTNNPVKVIDLITESINIAAAGKCLSPYTGTEDSEEYIPIKDALDFYKASFATDFYSGLQTNAFIAKKMAGSYILTGDYTEYLRAMDRIKKVSAQDVQRAARTYIKPPPKQWAVTAHPDIIEEIKKNHAGYAATYKVIELK